MRKVSYGLCFLLMGVAFGDMLSGGTDVNATEPTVAHLTSPNIAEELVKELDELAVVHDVLSEDAHFEPAPIAEEDRAGSIVQDAGYERKVAGAVPELHNAETMPAGPFAKPLSSLKNAELPDTASYKEPARKSQYSTPTPNSAAYYATQDASKDSMSGSDGDGASAPAKKRSLLSDLAVKLNKRISLDKNRQKQEDRARQQRQKRFSISREYAAPVERVIEAYNDPQTTLYDVLGVRRGISDAALRKAYRAKALDIHPGMFRQSAVNAAYFLPVALRTFTAPFQVCWVVRWFLLPLALLFACAYLRADKNPHPDAKVAFDALQEAYDAISSPTKRAEYDQELSRKVRVARAKRWSVRRMKKHIHDTLTNWKSSLQLFHHEITHIEGTPGRVGLTQSAALLWRKVSGAAQAVFARMVEHIALNLEHYGLLPSTKDKLLLLSEQLGRHKFKWTLVVLILGLLLRR
jgi:hypothetical protein